LEKAKAHLFGSGALLNEALKAAEILEKSYQVASDVWSVTSYKNLHVDAQEVEKWNLHHQNEPPRVPFITEQTKNEEGVFVAVSDYVQMMSDAISKWLPAPLHSLGTFGFAGEISCPSQLF
jgi:pyruvate dehydrogenase E1 component